MEIGLRSEAEHGGRHGCTGVERVAVPAAEVTKAQTGRGREIYRSLSEWELEIQNVFARGKASTIELARAVHAAKNTLRRGQWTQLWKSGRLPFSKRKGEMLAVVGKNLSWLNAQTFAHLPSGWSVLYCLAQLDRKILERLIGEGAVHPSLTLQGAKALLARFRGNPVPSSPSINLKQRLHRFQEFVRTNCQSWSWSERNWFKAELGELIDELESGCPDSPGARDRFLMNSDSQHSVPLTTRTVSL